MADLAALQKGIGHEFKQIYLLQQALTHPSLSNQHNQRLEFLGDAVLELCVSEKIFVRHPDLQEGAMTQLRQKLVREEKLAAAAESIHLGDYLLMDKGFAASGGRKKPSVLCDAFEAVLAAVYLDGGLDAARKMVGLLIGECAEKPETDAKSALQEFLQAGGKDAPTYKTVGEEGPPHERVFTAAVLVNGQEIARGSGTSKKRAEQEAARAAMEIIRGSGE